MTKKKSENNYVFSFFKFSNIFSNKDIFNNKYKSSLYTNLTCTNSVFEKKEEIIVRDYAIPKGMLEHFFFPVS